MGKVDEIDCDVPDEITKQAQNIVYDWLHTVVPPNWTKLPPLIFLETRIAKALREAQRQ